MKKLFSILVGFVLLTLSALSLESDFKNSLLKVDFVKTAADSYNIQLYTQKPYSEPIKVIKKTNTNYYLLLPETFHSVSSVTPLGDIKNVEVKLFPYAGQDLNNGYTKINIFTAKPVNIRASLKTTTGAVAPSIDTKKLAQLDSNFNSKQAQLQAQQRAAAQAAAQKAAQEAAAKKAQAQAAQKAAEAQKAKQLQAQKAAQEAAAQRAAQEAAKQKALKEQQAAAAAKKAAEQQAQAQAAQKAKIAAEQKAIQEQQKIAQEKRLQQERAQAIAAQKEAQKAAEQAAKQQSAQTVQKPVKQQVQKSVQKPVVTETIQVKPTTQTIVIDEENKENIETAQAPSEEIIDNETVVNETPEVDSSIQPIPLTLVEKIKNKLSPLKPYYYIIIDNLVLAIASIVAIFGILALILISKSNKKKAQKEEASIQNSLENNTEESDLSVFGEIDTHNNPLSGESSDTQPMFKDELENNEHQAQSSVQTLEQTAYDTEELDESYVEPQVLSSVEIAPNRGFMVIEQQGIKALFGYIFDDVFLIYTFKEYISNSDIKFRISEKQEDRTFFIVKVDRFKLLVRVTKTNMKLELEM